MKKLTPTQLDVLMKMANGAKLTHSTMFAGETSLQGQRRFVRADTMVSLLRGGFIAESEDKGIRVIYTITGAGREAIKLAGL